MEHNNYEDALDDGVTEIQQPATSSNAGDAEVVDVDFSHQEPPSPFSTTLCEGYADKRGKCPHYAHTRVMCGIGDDETFQSLCEPCYQEFESDRRQAQQDESGECE